MVMDHLPRSGFPLIDVRDANIDNDLLSGKLELPTLDTGFVGYIPCHLDDLIFQANVPF